MDIDTKLTQQELGFLFDSLLSDLGRANEILQMFMLVSLKQTPIPQSVYDAALDVCQGFEGRQQLIWKLLPDLEDKSDYQNIESTMQEYAAVVNLLKKRVNNVEVIPDEQNAEGN